MNNHHHVFLLKNPDTDSPHTDSYVSTLASHGLTSWIIPTLSHSFTEPDRLADIIGRGGGNEYGGVVVTSGRAVDAWGNALRMLHGKDVNGEAGWRHTPFYVVGPRTQSQLLDLQTQTPNALHKFLPSPDLVLGARESGTGEALARFISIDYPARNTSNLRLLYLVGDKNAGGVESVLKEAGIGLEMVQVYATAASETFEQDFRRVVDEAGGSKPACVVFFAPSSAELALPTIRKHFTLRTSSSASSHEDKPVIKVAAIGPSTARALSNKHDILVDVVSKKPGPNALAEAIVSLSS
ncbi:hypothetical protein FRC08_004819 [Ceratobasidium sp. 394]|nr:hypothetical protein FRC08_004819 [Ceratobasidium sp. 394]KAG9075481.1 hypothetical protein FS749_012838 [Ceratobasidium sp. UAMH 11750]